MGTTPSVEGAAERRRALRSAALYTSGLVFGALFYALSLSLLFGAFDAHRLALELAGGAGLVFSLAAVSGHRIPTYGRRWQVPRRWVTRDTRIGFVASGFVLGLGFLTPIRYPTFVIWSALLAALPAEPAVAAAVIYGVARGFSNWRGALGPVTPGLAMPERLMRRNARFTRAIDVVIPAFCVAVVIVFAAGQAGSAVNEGDARSNATEKGSLVVADGQPVAGERAGVFVSARPVQAPPPYSGLWFVPLRGHVRPLLSRDWIPMSRSTRGVTAAFAAPGSTGELDIDLECTDGDSGHGGSGLRNLVARRVTTGVRPR